VGIVCCGVCSGVLAVFVWVCVLLHLFYPIREASTTSWCTESVSVRARVCVCVCVRACVCAVGVWLICVRVVYVDCVWYGVCYGVCVGSV
jgi:hypothetical protein